MFDLKTIIILGKLASPNNEEMAVMVKFLKVTASSTIYSANKLTLDQ